MMDDESMSCRLSTLLAQVAAVEAAREVERQQPAGPNAPTVNNIVERGERCAIAQGGGVMECAGDVWEQRRSTNMDVQQNSPWMHPQAFPHMIERPADTATDDLSPVQTSVSAATLLGGSPPVVDEGKPSVDGSVWTPCAYRHRESQQMGETAEGIATTPSISPTSACAGLTPSESAHGTGSKTAPTTIPIASASAVVPHKANDNICSSAPQLNDGLPGGVSEVPSAWVSRLDWGAEAEYMASSGGAGMQKGVTFSIFDKQNNNIARSLNELLGAANVVNDSSPLRPETNYCLSERFEAGSNVNSISGVPRPQVARPEKISPEEVDVLMGLADARFDPCNRRHQQQRRPYDTCTQRAGNPDDQPMFPLSSTWSMEDRIPAASLNSRSRDLDDILQWTELSLSRCTSRTSGVEQRDKNWNDGDGSGEPSMCFGDFPHVARPEVNRDDGVRLPTRMVHHRHYSSHPIMQQQRSVDVSSLRGGSVGSERCQSAPFTAAQVRSFEPMDPSRVAMQLSLHSGRIVKMASDQQGCRMLQSVLERYPYNSQEVQCIVTELLPVITSVMTDPYGNFLVQKLLEIAPNEERMHLLSYYISGSLCEVAVSPHGNYAVQKLIDSFRSKQEGKVVCLALQRGALWLMKDLNGSHVIQKLLQCIDQENLVFLYDIIVEHTVDVCNDKYGCCVVQKCMDHASALQLQRVKGALLPHMVPLSLNPYGNYVVTHIIGMHNSSLGRHVADEAARCVGPVLEVLCENKFASNVVEKIVRACSPNAKLELCNFLFKKSTISTVVPRELLCVDSGTEVHKQLQNYCQGGMQHQSMFPQQQVSGPLIHENTALESIVLNEYGNYVVQTMLTVLPISLELVQLLLLLHQLSPEIMKHNFGKRVGAKMEQARDRIMAHLQEREHSSSMGRHMDATGSASFATNRQPRSGGCGSALQVEQQEEDLIQTLFSSLKGLGSPMPHLGAPTRGTEPAPQRAEVPHGIRSQRRKQPHRGRKDSGVKYQ